MEHAGAIRKTEPIENEPHKGWNMEEELISVIVAIYNIEDFVEKCVQSVQNQDYQNLEIILVDDGAADRSGEICDAYAGRDKRIRVYHNSNHGLSHARNFGIDHSHGGYLVFVDGDDWLHPQMISILYYMVKKYGADMASCGFERVNSNFDQIRYAYEDLEPRILSGGEACKDVWITYVMAWNKLYKRDIFDDIRYPDGRIHEDEFVIHKIFYKCGRICSLKTPLYFYTQRGSSIINNITDKSMEDGLDALRERVIFAEKNWSTVLTRAIEQYFDFCIARYCMIMDGQVSANEKWTGRLLESARTLRDEYPEISIDKHYELFLRRPELYMRKRKWNRWIRSVISGAAGRLRRFQCCRRVKNFLLREGHRHE